MSTNSTATFIGELLAALYVPGDSTSLITGDGSFIFPQGGTTVDGLRAAFYESGDPLPLGVYYTVYEDSIMPIDIANALNPIEPLKDAWEEWIYGHGKNITIIRSVSGIVSLISSFILIRMIMKSKQRFSTTYNRILLGMSIGDLIYSLPFVEFGAMAPSETDYWSWGARGNQSTCTAQGFFVICGMTLTLCYSCSLNIFYLLSIKYNKTDSYIRTKIEPFLHGVPILIALILAITDLAFSNYNVNNLGVCVEPVYHPPHCIGYENGLVREGFTIPCGRGQNEGSFFMIYSAGIVQLVSPVVVAVTLGILHRHVSKQEKSMARFGVGDVNRDNSNSRAVMQKAFAYSLAYFLTWGWGIVEGIIFLVTNSDIPVWLLYLWMFFNPLQGFFNLLIYMHPKVVAAKKAQVYLPRAFVVALWAGVTGQTVGDIIKKKEKKDPPVTTPAAASTTSGSIKLGQGNNPSTTGQTSIQLSSTHYKTSGDIEDEKAEIRSPLMMTNSLKTLPRVMLP